jgi:hypothetical protein
MGDLPPDKDVISVDEAAATSEVEYQHKNFLI